MLSSSTKKIVSLSLPMAGVQFITVAGGFLCMSMLAQLGEEVLAASALIYSTQLSIMVIGMSLLLSLGILVGHAYGANNYMAVGHFLQQAWALGLMIGIPIIILFWNIDSILILIGQEKEIVQLVQTFFNAYIWAVIPLLLTTSNQKFCYGTHNQKLAILISCLSVIVLLITAYVLIFGKWGFPTLGVAGLGYAMAAQVWFSLLVMTTCFYFRKNFQRFHLFKYRIHKDWSYLVQMFKVGGPISLQISGEMLSVLAGAAMVGWLGTEALAAYQIFMQYFFLAIIPIFALAHATGILIGQACGSEQREEIKKLGSSSLHVTLLISLIVGALFILFPKILASLYLDVAQPENTEIVRLVTILFAIGAFTVLLDGIKNVMTGALRGLLDSKFPMLIGLFTIWVIGIPLSYLFAFTFNFGVIGVAIGSMIGMFLSAVIILYRWKNLTTHH